MAAGNAVNSELLYRRAVAILERASGPDHPDVAVLLNNLAEHLRREGRQREAEPLYRRALDIQDRRLRSHPAHAATLNNWAEFLAGRRHKKEAEASYRKALNIAQATVGSKHLLVASIKENLARHLRSIRRNEEAMALLQEALEIRTEKQGARHPDVLKTFAALQQLRQGRTPPSGSIALSALQLNDH
jgi:tetratricopeptide (TPR) repeat protein